MNYDEFVRTMKEVVEQLVRKDMRVEIRTTLKNNGKELVGLSITDSEINITPAIYLEDFYEMYQNGDSIEKLGTIIGDIYKKVKCNQSIDVQQYSDYSQMKDKVLCKLINMGKNKKLLEEIPHIKYLDLAIVFYILLDSNNNGLTTMLVRNFQIVDWKINKEELFQKAIENGKRLVPAEFCEMKDVIGELINQVTLEEEEQCLIPMYVLSNSMRNLGAASILYDNLLKEIGEKIDENYFILPSSIHEWIVMGESKAPTIQELTEMIQEINATQVADEEVLSDHPYYYDRIKETLLY